MTAPQKQTVPKPHMLAVGGAVTARMAGYEPRPQQLAMAQAVTAAFHDEKHLLVEAGTGVGKSFAYLIPAIELAVSAGQRVVISTHTIALQEQLIEKDIPFLRSVFPGEFTAVLVKGRSNYLGLRRLTRASKRQELLFDAKGQFSELWRIEEWAYKTQDGSLTDLSWQPSLPVWERVRSETDDCLGRQCPTFGPCFYQRARRRAAEAQLLIVNHALFFSDLALRQQGSSILPDYAFVVLDEAHTVENVAGDHMGASLTDTQMRFLLNSLFSDRTGKGLLHGKANKGAIAAVHETRRVVDGYFDALHLWMDQRPNWNGRLREPPPGEQRITPAFVELSQSLNALRDDVKDEGDRAELSAAVDRCKAMARSVDLWHSQKVEDWVYWIEMGEARRQRMTLCGRPLNVGAVLKESLFDKMKSVVMTSATLTTSSESPFAYLQHRLGAEEARSLLLGSPFDYRTQMTVYVEADMSDPSAPEFTTAACAAIPKYLTMSEGRAFVLFTSYAMMQQCARTLASFLEENRMPLLVQGTGLPRTAMLNRFRSVPRSVLFGTDTFWEGVDVPGEALSNVILVKLPFAAPNQPIVEARIERIREAGGNPFMDFQIPEAILKFKQGVGRLIRTRTDRGIVVILDPRVLTKPYGKWFLKALPDCERVIQSRASEGVPAGRQPFGGMPTSRTPPAAEAT